MSPDSTYSLASPVESEISHDDALKAASALIDFYFGNGPRRVQTRVPVEPTDTDVLLTNYIKQQRELADAIANSTEHADAAQKWECEKAELLNGLKSSLHYIFKCGQDRDIAPIVERIEALIAKYEAK